METMTQNTLADLRSMEDAAEDQQDRYFFGLCTLFVATIEDAKDRISQLELVFCSQLFPAFQARLLESRHELQKSEKGHEQSQELLKRRISELVYEIEDLRACRDSEVSELRKIIDAHSREASQFRSELRERSKLHTAEIEALQQEVSRLRNQIKSREVQEHYTDTISKGNMKLSKEAVPEIPLELQQDRSSQNEIDKLPEETSKVHPKDHTFPQDPIYSGHLKSNILPPTSSVLGRSISDAENLKLKLEQKSQERGLECFQRQLLSMEADKERRNAHAALIKLHALKKRYRSLRKQYTVLFRHSHLCDLRKQSAMCKNELVIESGRVADDKCADISKSLDPGELKAKHYGQESSMCGVMSSSCKSVESGSFNLDEKMLRNCSYEAATPDKSLRQPCETADQQDMDYLTREESPESLNALRIANGVDKIAPLGATDGPDESCRVLTTEKLVQLEDTDIVKECPKQDFCNMDEASQVGVRTDLHSKVAKRLHGFEISGKHDEYMQDSFISRIDLPKNGEGAHGKIVEHPPILEAMEKNLVGSSSIPSSDEGGWFPVQKRPSITKHNFKARKCPKTTWRNTRCKGGLDGFDPHDDFLNTPQVNVLQLHKDREIHEENEADCRRENEVTARISSLPARNCEQSATKNKSFSQLTTQAHEEEVNVTSCENHLETSNKRAGSMDSTSDDKSDDHFKDVPNVKGDKIQKLSTTSTTKGKGVPTPRRGPMYKFVEPVRKKDDREMLQGVECKQCKKFYDAVLSKDGPNAASERCQHHSTVSRHRYRYMPPSTPEGFWNIGFDSEI
ncbi:hypothetical protein KP509_11G035500 [Ceratopteris richardii]|uniref:DNA endonuclease activator Ctp1 C-terminal domain-containing protein n=1 Tax=Ceratopteris richardii TaxID=49495 RepID=A0A8T2TQF4_CERRI|nr:hypothetical protein KP509_11G035500 [Ceratopteris richardii]